MSEGNGTSRAPVAVTQRGSLRGLPSGESRAFIGIPYATAPRFAAPLPVEGGSGIRDVVAVGPASPQPRRPIAEFTHGPLPPTSEECLSLNVWAPAGGSDGLPVLVWVHGGGFVVGWGSASLYDGASIAAAAGAVVVTLNYRLGSLGWLHHPAHAAQEGCAQGNWGLLDVVAALEWVRENVAAFGGDPARVTLAGQSAGALLIADLLAGSGAAGLFARAIVQSPPMFDALHEPDLGRRWTEALGARAGGGEQFDPEVLRRLPAQRVVELHEELLADPAFRGTRGGALPIRDVASAPWAPSERPAGQPEVDVLVGTTADEGTFFFRATRRPKPDDAGLEAIVARLVHDEREDPGAIVALERRKATERGLPRDNNSLLVRIATQLMVAGPTARWANARAAEGGRVYSYRVDHAGPDPDLGATHTAEVPLVFGTYDDGGPGTRLAGGGSRAAEASAAMMCAWGAFVRGEPMGWGPLETDRCGPTGIFGGIRPFGILDAVVSTVDRPGEGV